MDYDPWLKEMRIGHRTADAPVVQAALEREIPVDGLQHAGSALLAVEPSEALAAIAHRVIEALDQRDWIGDAELIAELKHRLGESALDLRPVSVPLDQVGEALDQSAGTPAVVDLVDGVVWPAEVIEYGEGPDVEDDLDSERWLHLHGEGSRAGYRLMERFTETVQDADLRDRLEIALDGSGAFRRFRRVLESYEHDYTRWHRFRYDAQLGRARAWLAEEGYRSVG